MKLVRFNQLIGNSSNIALLKRSLTNDRVRPFVIFTGVFGTGKTTSSVIAAMSLTCENRQDGEPCLECDSCKANMRALASTGKSPNVYAVNMATVGSKKDMQELLKEIFVLAPLTGRKVYILGEFHAIKKEDQLPFLEHIDMMDDNTYVFITTTDERALLPELVDRATVHRFKRMNSGESNLLFDREIARLNLKVSPALRDMIIRHARGIPRTMKNIIQFTLDNSPSEEELIDHLGYVSGEVFVDLFRQMGGSLRDMAITIKDLLDNHDAGTLSYELRNFMVEACYASSGVHSDKFKESDVKDLRNLFGNKIFKATIMTDVLDSRSSESDLRMIILKIYNYLHSQGLADIVLESKPRATEQVSVAASTMRERNELAGETEESRLTPLDKDSLRSRSMDLFNDNNNNK